jgi:hypothetical protein
MTKNATTGGYDAYLLVAMKLGKTTDVTDIEPEAFRHVILKQNYPNPCSTATTIPFRLMNPSQVTIDVYDMMGKKMQSILDQQMDGGDHEVVFNNTNGLLAKGNYVYQVVVVNELGRYHQCKVLTIQD